jgi:3-hydroxypropanoate dehydrogenase
MMESAVSESALNQLFLRARAYNERSDKTVDDCTVRQVYELLKWGPTSANSCPARFMWVQSSEGRSRLAALASERNRPKIAAPLTVIIGNDLSFPDTLPKLIGERAAEAAKYFAQPGVTESTAMRNGSLQGAYLIIAARARLGLRAHVGF